MIVFEKVSKHYEQKNEKITAVKNVDLFIQPKEIFGIIGESGSGKSTLLKLLNTLEKPDNGMITIDGKDISKRTKAEQREDRRKTGMIFQHFNLLYNKTIAENVALPLKLSGIENPEKVNAALRFVKMEEKRNRFPKQLSGGEKQRAAVARALVSEPTLLLCDEPTSALDGQHAYEISKLLQKVNEEFGTTIVIVSHELELIRTLCSRAAVMEKGQLLETVTISQPEKAQTFSSYYDRIKETLNE
ncbi:ATP-binding cassette domain-containing protein [Enterococcus sp. BWB1-3]|uniref:methionine ABC transporter ATP-binding protein n=1 Tax=unclassified Enterococcus TaxID=2608891 RepID=UPI0019235D7D|nr:MULTISPECIES: ATP-binding cassette domain-containing protein [unclassified Enterococcus]MBL1228828.1 ATP-binding cassette domain-containing protein [Enterococcus sp. BWB1-3]MCB5951630.1 ATP-binding cassette domain-containing protein [Enterococcus sp. BWT-B8]MCB5954722.1 ATP-binding cassette domain-containing protein [Enterococcus sp. CWB-B31]